MIEFTDKDGRVIQISARLKFSTTDYAQGMVDDQVLEMLRKVPASEFTSPPTRD